MLIWVKRAGLVVMAFLVVAQFIRPRTVNPPADPTEGINAHIAVQASIQSILDRSCNDCHSNHTVWPWYSHVAPASWLVASDVKDGRRHLNFSEWGTYTDEKRAKALDEVCKEVREGDMPPFQYTPMPPGSELTQTDQEQVCRWTSAAKQNLMSGDGAEVP